PSLDLVVESRVERAEGRRPFSSRTEGACRMPEPGAPAVSRTLLFLALVIPLAPASALAQGSAPTMVFSQYLARVLDRNRDLSAARSDVDAARARVQVAARLPEPRLWGGIGSY